MTTAHGLMRIKQNHTDTLSCGFANIFVRMRFTWVILSAHTP